MPFRFAALGAALLLSSGCAVQAEEDEAEYVRFLEAARSYTVSAGDAAVELELHAESLLQWTNPVRDQERGSVFVWLRYGRPEVIGSIFTYQYEGKAYDKVEFHSLSAERLRMTRGGEVVWTPRPGLQWMKPSGMSRPSPNPRQRLVQMRQIARTYTVRLSDPQGQQTDLRFLTQPLFRYGSRDAGVLDGAIFSYAVATDPETLLIVEAAGDAAAPEWRYAFARFHYWPLEAESSAGDIVWSADEDAVQASHQIGDASQFEKPYVSFRPSIEPVRSVAP